MENDVLYRKRNLRKEEMDIELKSIYDNILIKQENENNYRFKIIKIFDGIDYSATLYYKKNEEEFYQDCNKLFQKIVSKKERIKRTISERTLKNILEDYIYFKLLSEKKIIFKNIIFSKQDINKILKELRNCENDFKNYVLKKYSLKKFEVFNRMYNIQINQKEELGTYTLYRFPENEKDIKVYLEHLEKRGQDPSKVIIKTIVEARDCDSAKDLAAEKNNELINIINFNQKSYILIEEDFNFIRKYSTISSIDGITDYTEETFPITLDFNDLKKAYFYTKLFPLTQKNELNFLENKIMISLQWYREFLHEKNSMNCLLKGIVSLESLVSTKELTKENGIQDYISKIVTIILEKENEEKFQNKIKKLYDKRSKIVHEGIAEVNFYDIFFLRKLISDILEKFIVEPKYLNLTTKKKYNLFFKK